MKKIYKVLHDFFGHPKKYCEVLLYKDEQTIAGIKCSKCGITIIHSDFIL